MGTENKKITKQEELKKVNNMLSEIAGLQEKKDRLDLEIKEIKKDIAISESQKDAMFIDLKQQQEQFIESSSKALDDIIKKEKSLKQYQQEVDKQCRSDIKKNEERGMHLDSREKEIDDKTQKAKKLIETYIKKLDELRRQESIIKSLKAEAQGIRDSLKNDLNGIKDIDDDVRGLKVKLQNSIDQLSKNIAKHEAAAKRADFLESEAIEKKKLYEEKISNIPEYKPQKADPQIAEHIKLANELEKSNKAERKNLDAYKINLQLKEGKIKDLMKRRKISEEDLD